MNEHTYRRLTYERRLEIVAGAGHLFDEPGPLDQVAQHAADWFGDHVAVPAGERRP